VLPRKGACAILLVTTLEDLAGVLEDAVAVAVVVYIRGGCAEISLCTRLPEGGDPD
jgi:hypothetical protein